MLQETNRPGNQPDTRPALRQDREYSKVADEKGFNGVTSRQPRISQCLEVPTKAFLFVQSRISKSAEVQCSNRHALFQKRSHLQ